MTTPFRFLPLLLGAAFLMSPVPSGVAVAGVDTETKGFDERLAGTWNMDATRSESAHQAVPIGNVQLVIQHTDFELRIETRRGKTASTPAEIETIAFRLDGTDNTVQGKDGASVRTKLRRDGAAIITETERELQGAAVTTRNRFSLNAKGTELTLERKLTVQHGYQGQGAKSYGTGTDIFIKTASVR